MNVVIYARYSSEKQTDQSIDGQLKVCHAYAKSNGYTVVEEYIDKALTGKSDNRPEFQRMISDSNKKHFQGVLVYQLDRFSRNRYDSATYKAKLKKNGVRVLSARENISDDASGILVEGLLESMAEYFSVELSQKVQRGMNINAEKCLSNGGSIPFGFKTVNKKFEINPDTTPIVEQIFEMYAGGKRVIDIINHLNAKQIKTGSGAKFNNSSLHTMLKNKKYIGVYKYADIEVPDGMPRIISDELFYKVAEMMDKNKKAPARARAKEDYILTTKLFCGHCKSLMVGFSGTSSTGKTYNYYSCNNARLKTCHKKNVQKDYIENLIIEECRKLLTDKNIAKIAKEVVSACEREKDGSGLKRLNQELKSNEKQKENLFQSLKICDIDSVRKSIFEEIANMEKAITAVKDEIMLEQAQYVNLTVPEITFFLSQLKGGNINDIKYRKMMITLFVNAVYLYDNEKKITLVLNSSQTPITIDNVLLDEIESNNETAGRSCFTANGSPVLFKGELPELLQFREFSFCTSISFISSKVTHLSPSS